MKKFDAATSLLALDFDGVIVDSIKECLVSGYNAYANYRSKKNIERFDELDPVWTAEARRLRNYIRNGEDYVYIAHALENNIPIHSQEDFDGFLQEHTSLRDTFFDLIYNQRISFSAAKPATWAALNPLYGGMSDFLVEYSHKENLYIITTKKLVFVHKILKANAIKLRDENIRDTSGERTKRAIIKEILDRRHVEPHQFYFVDDQVDTLIKLQSTRIHLFLAKWGYNTAAQVKSAQENSIQVLSLENFRDLFYGWPSSQ